MTEGRDQGTIVFPRAFRKFFLTADEVERARRRLADLKARGEECGFEAVLADQRARDLRDAARAIAPMKPADDAELIDTTGKTIDQVVEELVGPDRSGRRHISPKAPARGVDSCPTDVACSHEPSTFHSLFLRHYFARGLTTVPPPDSVSVLVRVKALSGTESVLLRCEQPAVFALTVPCPSSFLRRC